MIELNGITKSYQEEIALKEIDLKLEERKTCAIIGPSGCGKTTLLYILAALIKPTAGTVKIDGQLQEEIREDVGVILQDYGLLPWKRVWENVALGLLTRNKSKDEIEEEVNSMLKGLKIAKFKDKYPAELSGGQKQRVAIGRTLAINPNILLMDEPSSSLDAITKEHLQNLLLEIYKKKQITMALVTHDIQEAVFLGQKIIIMDQAEIKDEIDNPYFGDENLRDKVEYYQLCSKIRRIISRDD